MSCNGTGSPRKPHNNNAGYVASRKNLITGCHTTIYVAKESGIDADTRFVVCCEAHGTLLAVRNQKLAYDTMNGSTAEWCEDCRM